MIQLQFIYLINKLEKVQCRAARFVVNDYSRYSSVTEILANLQWNSLKNRRTVSRLSVLQKSRQNLLALPVNDLLLPARRQSRHQHPNCFQVIASNKDCHKYSYFPQTVKDWNSLPYSITTIEDTKQFKTAVISHLNQQD